MREREVKQKRLIYTKVIFRRGGWETELHTVLFQFWVINYRNELQKKAQQTLSLITSYYDDENN